MGFEKALSFRWYFTPTNRIYKKISNSVGFKLLLLYFLITVYVFKKMKKLAFAAAIFGLFLTSCNYVFTAEPTKLDKPARQVSRILFVENAERRTSDFFNSLRKDLLISSKGEPIQPTFVRLFMGDKNLENRLPEAKKRDLPEAMMFFEALDLKGPKWGVWRNSAWEMRILARLESAETGEKLWEGSYFLKEFWGVDVLTDKLAQRILSDLKAAGVLKN